MYHVEQFSMQPVTLKLKHPFKTAHSTTFERPLTLIKLEVFDEKTHQVASGFGEVQSFADFSYAPENQQMSRTVIETMILPYLKSYSFNSAPDFASYLQQLTPFASFAKAGIEMAVWDAVGKLTNQSLAQMIGGSMTKVPVGIAFGLDVSASDIRSAILEGYQRIKLKIQADNLHIEQLTRLLEQFPQQHFSLDANSSFRPNNVELLKQLPDNVLFIEQPFAATDFVDHAHFQLQTKQLLSLDESINNINDIRTLVALRAARAVTIKQGKIGGISAAIAAIELAQISGIRPWIGGMLSSNLGRGVDLALASLEGIAFAGDIADSQHYFQTDITEEALAVHKGFMDVPQRPGIGLTVNDMFSTFL